MALLGFFPPNLYPESRDDYPSQQTNVLKSSPDFQSPNEMSQLIHRERMVTKAIQETNEDRDEARNVAYRLKQKLAMAEAKLTQVKKANQTQREQQFLQMYDFLFNQIPGYRSVIPPVDYSVVEREDQVGSYQLQYLLGSGGFADVNACQHERTGETYAIKGIRKHQIQNMSDLTQLGREIQIMHHAIHPNVVHCHDVIHAAQHIYLVMDLSTFDLFDYCSQYDLSDATNREVLAGLLQGLECLHSIGVAHLDIKPENILVKQDVPPDQLTRDDIQICDLGLCMISEDAKGPIQIESFVGTSGFIAPELVLNNFGRPNVVVEGRKADMFSVGVLLLELLEGPQPPTWDAIWRSCLHRGNGPDVFEFELTHELHHISQRHFIPHNPVTVHALLCKLLLWDPQQRFTAVQALQHPWMIADLTAL